MPVTRRSALAIGLVLGLAAPAFADGEPAITRTDDAAPEPLDLRLTLSTFLYRETGADAPAVVDQGATLQNASPVRRYFGDLRLELGDAGFKLDARVRQTTSERFQSGADGGGEYEIRTLDYQLGSSRTFLTIGRQYIDSVGATKIDGLAFTRRFSTGVSATVFGGALPALGSRSLDTDYPRIRTDDGTTGSPLVPLAGGLGIAYQTANYHGDVGVGGLGLTNGSVGIDARPSERLQLTASVNHVSTDLLAIAARNALSDPDPSAIGIVQNNIAVLRISQDAARGAATLALAQQRFELSVSGGVHLRPAVSVALADGSGAVTFPEAKSADTTFTVLDRRSLGGLRASLSAVLTFPIGSEVPNLGRGTIVRLGVSRSFAEQRGQLEADVMGEHFRDVDANHGMCMTSTNVFACYGTASTTAGQAGVLASWRVAREWLLLADTHVGYQDVHSISISGPVAWPKLYSLTTFVRVQWRYR